MSDRNSKVSGRNSKVSNRPKFKDFRNSQTKSGFRKRSHIPSSYGRGTLRKGRNSIDRYVPGTGPDDKWGSSGTKKKRKRVPSEDYENDLIDLTADDPIMVWRGIVRTLIPCSWMALRLLVALLLLVALRLAFSSCLSFYIPK